MALTRVDVELQGEAPAPAGGSTRSYAIFIDPDAGAETRLAEKVAARAPSAVGLLTDDTVAQLHLARFKAALEAAALRVVPLVVPDGEGSKSFHRMEAVCEGFVRGGLDRRSLIAALGGGVVGDLGGFVASILLRGVGCVQLPTTLLAQVDSSVGGKTGVNLPSGKNLAGTFSQPLFVYADVTTLATLSARDISAGLAEVVKHGAIADAALFEDLESRAEDARAGDPALLAELVASSCRIKAAIVAADERETDAGDKKGGRARLNFGHTVGHALESASYESPRLEDEPLRHGEAVALGMIAAARVGVALGVGDRTLEERLLDLLPRLGLPVDLDARLSPSVLARVGVDKKRAGATLQLVLVDHVGSSTTARVTSEKLGEILLRQKYE